MNTDNTFPKRKHKYRRNFVVFTPVNPGPGFAYENIPSGSLMLQPPEPISVHSICRLTNAFTTGISKSYGAVVSGARFPHVAQFPLPPLQFTSTGPIRTRRVPGIKAPLARWHPHWPRSSRPGAPPQLQPRWEPWRRRREARPAAGRTRCSRRGRSTGGGGCNWSRCPSR